MKILVLTRYDSLGASSRIRILQYLPYLQMKGFTLDVHPLFDNNYVQSLQHSKRNLFSVFYSYLSRMYLLLFSKKYDLVWIEKEIFPWIPYSIERVFLKKHSQYVIDYDDAVYHWYDQSKNKVINFLLKNKHKFLIQQSSSVIVGNSYLKNYAVNAGAQSIIFLPTSINLIKYEKLDAGRQSRNQRRAVIGWIGQQSTAHNLVGLQPILSELVCAKKASFCLIGIDGKFLNIPVHSIPWSESHEVQDILKFDIGIMPLQDEPFERGKCGYKLIQYMACGIPVIGSGVGENKNIIKHGTNGFIANTPSEWREYLTLLINDEKLRADMGLAGKKIVMEKYSTKVTAPILRDLFNSMSNL
jgi:glycosyltransferase involved in cell wall biosynthesis